MASGLAWVAAALVLVTASTAAPVPVPAAPAQPHVLAQSPDRHRPALKVPTTVLAAPGGEVRLEVEIAGVESLPQKAFVRLRGVPAGVTLSEGHQVTPGVWAVPLGSLANLRLRLPADLQGKTSLHLSLTTVDGPPLAEASTALVVAAAVAATAAPAPPKAATTAAPPPRKPAPAVVAPVAPPPKAATDPEAAKRALAFKSRGEKALAVGNIADARLYLERAAEFGVAEAALMLGLTYDPAELKRMRTVGVVAEPDRARHWYGLAQTLGSAEAAARLRRLGAR